MLFLISAPFQSGSLSCVSVEMQSDGCFILVYLGVLSLPITVICCRYGMSDSSKVQGHIVEWCNMMTVPWWWESTTRFKVLKLCTLECNLVLASAG
jgi:hypothetical protein